MQLTKLALTRHLSITFVQTRVPLSTKQGKEEKKRQPGRIPGLIHPVLVSDTQNIEKNKPQIISY